jgi:hypothetical protein
MDTTVLKIETFSFLKLVVGAQIAQTGPSGLRNRTIWFSLV